MTLKFWMWGFAGLLAASVTSGCSSTDTEAVAANKTNVLRRYELAPNSPVSNGRFPNGRFANGRFANGRFANGRFANGRFANGRFANGTLVQGSEEEDHPVIEFVELDTALVQNGSALLNLEIDATLSDGGSTAIKVVGYDDSTVPGMELYKVVYVGGADNGKSICGDKDGDPIWATLLPQRFNPSDGADVAADPGQFTFSCRFGGIQKCQEYGYPKNQKKFEDLSGQSSRRRRLADYHSACVRMVRADYCGDGVPHTFDGTTIDIYDHLRGGNTPATSTDGSDGFHYEAEWEADGAHCINKTRWMNAGLSGLTGNRSGANEDYEYIRAFCPQRFAFSVTKLDGNPSVPDRTCGSGSTWNSSVGFSFKNDDAADQSGRGLIRNNSILNVHAE